MQLEAETCIKKGGKRKVKRRGYLRSNNNEAMRSNMLDEERVERIIEKVTMEENKKWEFSSFTWRGYQEWFWRWNNN